MDTSTQVELEKVPLFDGLREDELRAIADKAVTRTFAKNATLVNEGDLTASLYVVLSGKVKVCLCEQSGKELVLDIKGPGQYFGEMALDEAPRSATVVALTTARLAIISRTDFTHLLAKHPDISMHLINDLVQIVRRLNKNVRSLAMLNVYGRVSRLLLDSAVEHNGKLVISEKLTQQDMASRVGASREMISRIFRGLSAGGYIKVEGKKITINKTLPPRW